MKERDKDIKIFFKNEIESDKENWEKNKYGNAIKKGYDDAKRTFAGIKSPADTFWEELAKEINLDAIFAMENSIDQDQFDQEHKKMCDILIEMFKKEGIYESVTYGQAQKIINMAFKYLYTYDYVKEQENNQENNQKNKEVYKYCHMPLDRYTLTWYRRVKEQMKKQMDNSVENYYSVTSDFAWSKKMDASDEGYEIYQKIQRGVRCCLGENVLRMEFEIWNREKKIQILSDILNGIKGYSSGHYGEIEGIESIEHLRAEIKKRKEELEAKNMALV